MSIPKKISIIFTALLTSLSLSTFAKSPDLDSSLEDAVLIHEIAKTQLAALESKLAASDKKELSALQAKLGALSYKFVKTKAFLAANAKIVMFEYPDIFVFTAITRVSKALFLLPIMTYLGHPGWGLVLNSIPDVELYDFIYFKIRQKMKRDKMKAVIGFSQSEIDTAKTNLLQELDKDMPLARLHLMQELGSVLFPIKSSSKNNSTPQRWVSTQELENVVGQEWTRQLISLDLDQALFENALLQKALTIPEFRDEMNKRKSFVETNFENDMIRFFVESEAFIDQIRGQLELNSKPLFSKKLFTDPEYKRQWKASYRLKVEIGNLINEIRNYQMSTLGQYEDAKKSKKLVDVNWERFLKDKADVLAKLDAFKNIFSVANPSDSIDASANEKSSMCIRYYGRSE